MTGVAVDLNLSALNAAGLVIGVTTSWSVTTLSCGVLGSSAILASMLVGERSRAYSRCVSFMFGKIAANEIAPKFVGGVHHDETASSGIDDQVTGLGDGTNQASDQSDRLDVRVQSAIDLLS